MVKALGTWWWDGDLGSCLLARRSLGPKELFNVPARATKGVCGHDNAGASMFENLKTSLAAIFPTTLAWVSSASGTITIEALEESGDGHYTDVPASELDGLDVLNAHSCFVG